MAFKVVFTRCRHEGRRFSLGLNSGKLCMKCCLKADDQFWTQASRYHSRNNFVGNYWYDITNKKGDQNDTNEGQTEYPI